MRCRNKYFAILVSWLLALIPLQAGLIFDADFSGPKKAVAQWENLDAIIKSNEVAFHDGGLEMKAAGIGDKTHAIVPKVKLPKTFSVEFKATSLLRSGDGNYIYLTVDGIVVKIYQYGLECLNGKEETLGQYNGIFNNKEHWFLIESGVDFLRVYCNGKLIRKVEKTKTGLGDFSFRVFNSNVFLKDFKIYEGERSRLAIKVNLLRNSSFEVVTNDLPDYWGTAHWGASPYWRTKMDEFHKRWRIDNTVSYEGKNSVRIDSTNDEKANCGLGLYSCWPGLREGTKYTFSVYLKSNRDALPVKIGTQFSPTAPEEQKVTVGKEWRRYYFTSNGDASSVTRVAIQPLDAGTLWVDAAQLEAGNQATPYVRYSSEQPGAIELNSNQPCLQVPQIERPPAMDGNMGDPAWKKAAKCVLVKTEDGTVPTEKTNVFLLRDENNLYMAVECFDSNMDKLVANVKQDKGLVWNDDSVEFFFKPDEKGRIYYQFALNSLGVKYEGRPLADMSWHAEWQATVRKGKSSWTAAITVPFSSLGIESSKDSLIFEFARNNHRNKEYTAWSPTFGPFNEFKNWGRLIFGSQVGGVFASNLKFVKTVPMVNIHALSALVVNNTKKDFNGKLKLVIKTEGRNVSYEQNLFSKADSSTPVAFSGLDLPDNQECRVSLGFFSSTNAPLLTKIEELHTLPLLSITPEFSYFSNEKDLRFAIAVNGCRREDKLSLHCSLFRDKERVFEQNLAIQYGSKPQVLVIPNRYGIGGLRLEVNLLDANRKALSIAKENCKVIAHLANEGKINLWRHAIQFAGNELFCWGNVVEYLPDEADIKIMSDAGFNAFILYSEFQNPGQISRLLSIGEKYQVKFIVWCGDINGGLKNTIKMAPFLVNQAAILAFLSLDEATGKISNDEMDTLSKNLRNAIGGNALILQNEFDLGVMRKADFRNADMVAVDHYTIPEGDLASVSWILDGLNRLAGNRPTCFAAQSTGNAYCYGREPTPAELYNQVYQAFVCDVWNILFFANIPLGKDNFPTLKRLRGEWDQLIAMDVPAASSLELSCSEDGIKFIGRETKDSYVIIAVSNRKTPAEVRFNARWIGAKSNVKALFESRSLSAKNGTFADEFRPLGRHVYVIDKKNAIHE